MKEWGIRFLLIAVVVSIAACYFFGWPALIAIPVAGIIFFFASREKKPAKTSPAPDGTSPPVTEKKWSKKKWALIVLVLVFVVPAVVQSVAWVTIGIIGIYTAPSEPVKTWFLVWEKPTGYRGTSPDLRRFEYQCNLVQSRDTVKIVGAKGDWEVTYQGKKVDDSSKIIAFTGKWTQTQKGIGTGSGMFRIEFQKIDDYAEGWITSDEAPGEEKDIHVPIILRRV